MHYYIAGPISNTEDGNEDRFMAARNALGKLLAIRDRLDFKISIPQDVDQDVPFAEMPMADRTWDWYMKKCLGLVIDCDVVVLLPGSDRSRGAKVETATAVALGKRVVTYQHLAKELLEPEWLEQEGDD